MRSDATSLLDVLMPRFDVSSRHTVLVPASPGCVAEAMERYRGDQDSSWIVRTLFRLRGLSVPGGNLRTALSGEGFSVLAERPGSEIVFGVAGRFWAPDERAAFVRLADARAFAAFAEPCSCKAAMSLRVEAGPGGATHLSTETRVACTDAAARWRFGLYWTLIRPFSGWIRRDMLDAIRRRAVALTEDPT